MRPASPFFGASHPWWFYRLERLEFGKGAYFLLMGSKPGLFSKFILDEYPKKIIVEVSTKFGLKKAINRFANPAFSLFFGTHLETDAEQLLSGLRMWSGKHIQHLWRHWQGMISLLWISWFLPMGKETNIGTH